MENKLHTDHPIGGPGKVVEIDESKFGKTKLHRGRVVNGQWVFGGICRETQEVFLVPLPDNKRDRATLEPLILSHIQSWTIHGRTVGVRRHLQRLSANFSYGFAGQQTGP